MTACIVGWSHMPFGKHEGEDYESMIGRVTEGALADAGIGAGDIDAIYLGLFNAGMMAQDFPASLALQAAPALRFKPATRVENACATGSAAIHAGLDIIGARRARLVLVVGVEKMTQVPVDQLGAILTKASYVKDEGKDYPSFAHVFGHLTQLYFQRYGDQSDALAHIAAKNHKNGTANPYAHVRKDLGYEFCRQVSEKNPLVAGPLKRTDCSMVSDGAAALVLSDADFAETARKAIFVRAAQQVNDFLPMRGRDMTYLEGCEIAWRRALAEAGVTLDDLDLVETHDCFTTAELIQYEAMGLTKRGQGARAVLEGWTEKTGKLPVNPSGGLKSKGHPIGATGVSMHVLAAMQLAGEAGGMQIAGAELAGVFNMGGTGVANYCTILEPWR